jgi:hypothetical protein
MFNTNLIQEEHTLSTLAKYDNGHLGLYLDVTIIHMIKKKCMSHSTAKAVTTFSIQGPRFDIIQPV